MSFRMNRRALIASLALAPVMAKAGPAFALTDQQELIGRYRRKAGDAPAGARTVVVRSLIYPEPFPDADAASESP